MSVPEENAAVTRALDDYELMLERNGTRKARGSYYTPKELVDGLIKGALEPALAGATTAADVLGMRMCDPACGTGRLLRAAGERMAAHLARVRGEKTVDHARAEVAGRCLFGLDVDAGAVERCRASLGEMG